MWSQSIFSAVFLVGVALCYTQSRVVNGTDSDIHKYPFVVSLRLSSGAHGCGASIIATKWILTAAHCVSGSNHSLMSIQYGASDIANQGPNIATVKEIIVHEDYVPSRAHANDIALLELDAQLVYNYKTIAPVTSPESNFEIPQVPEGASGTLIGWGFEKTGGTVQKNLQEVDLKIYSDEECTSRHNGRTNGDHICGGIDEGGKGQGAGDSGGPLPYHDSVQLGIVSWSVKPCAIYPYPGVYTKVSHYIDWIHKQIN